MKKIIIFIVMFFVGLNVYALDACTTSEMNRLNELAKNVEFKTSYKFGAVDEEYKDVSVSYDIDIINFDNDLKITYVGLINDEEIEIKSSTKKLEGFLDGDTITFKIYAYTNNACIDKLLKTVKVNLKSVNRYYYFNKDKCSNYPNFNYCKEFTDTLGIDFNEIDKEFDEYIKSLNTKEQKDNEEKKNSSYIPMLIGGSLGIVIAVVIVLVTIKNKKKDDL